MLVLSFGQLPIGRLKSLCAVVQRCSQIGDLSLQIIRLLAPQADLFAPDGKLALRGLRLPVQRAGGAMPLTELIAQLSPLFTTCRNLVKQ